MFRNRAKKFTSVALLVGVTFLASCGGGSESESRQRNAGIAAGLACPKPGAVVAARGISYICATAKSAGKTSKVWYGVAATKNWKCAKPGVSRYQNGIFSVCAAGKNSKSHKWAFTLPLAKFAAPNLSSDAAALESAGVAMPVVSDPGIASPAKAAVGDETAAAGTETSVAGTETTASTTLGASPSVTVPATESTTATKAPSSTSSSSVTIATIAPPTTSRSSATTATTATTTPTSTSTPVPTVEPVKMSVAASRPVCGDWPRGEEVAKAVDGNPATKFVCYWSNEGLGGLEVDLARPGVLTGLKFVTGNDCPRRDPVRVRVSGRSGSSGSWTSLGTVTLSLPNGRTASGGPYDVENSASFSSYRVVVETKKVTASCEHTDNVMQFSEIEFIGTP